MVQRQNTKGEKVSFTYKQRLKCLENYPNCTDFEEANIKYGMCEKTFRNWRRGREYITLMVQLGHGRKFRIMLSRDEDIEAIGKLVLNSLKESECEVTYFDVVDQIRLYLEANDIETEHCLSRGWYYGFMNRNNLKPRLLTGERRSADKEAAEEYKVELAELIVGLALLPQQISNCDETRLTRFPSQKISFSYPLNLF